MRVARRLLAVERPEWRWDLHEFLNVWLALWKSCDQEPAVVLFAERTGILERRAADVTAVLKAAEDELLAGSRS